QKNINEFMTLLMSLVHHLQKRMDIELYMQKVIIKNSANRPAFMYVDLDKTGHRLSDEEAVMKYTHNEQLNRELRNNYEGPLQPWLYDSLFDLYDMYDQTELALEKMKDRIVLHNAMIAQTIVQEITEESKTA